MEKDILKNDELKFIENLEKCANNYIEKEKKSNFGLLIKSDGTTTKVYPENLKDFSVEELNKFVNGHFEILTLHLSDEFIVCNENGKLLSLPFNKKATNILLNNGFDDFIAGDVLLCSTKMIL